MSKKKFRIEDELPKLALIVSGLAYFVLYSIFNDFKTAGTVLIAGCIVIAALVLATLMIVLLIRKRTTRLDLNSAPVRPSARLDLNSAPVRPSAPPANATAPPVIVPPPVHTPPAIIPPPVRTITKQPPIKTNTINTDLQPPKSALPPLIMPHELFQETPKQEPENNKYKIRPFLSKTETIFYQQLVAQIKPPLIVQCKIGLWAVVKNTKHADWNKISQKHLDFAIFDTKTCEVILVIELDDYSHQSPKAQARDAAKNAILHQAGIPLMRVQVGKEYDFDRILSGVQTAQKKSRATV